MTRKILACAIAVAMAIPFLISTTAEAATTQHVSYVAQSAQMCADASLPKGCKAEVITTSGPMPVPAGAKVHAGADWTYACGYVYLQSILGGIFWHSRVNTCYQYDDYVVEIGVGYVDCSDLGGIGFSVSVTWCGTWNNGGKWVPSSPNYYMNMGDNFTVCALAGIFPACSGKYQRFNVTISGRWWITHS